ncbi:hypothetical protein [Brunnivagina elsteri]|uniref:hypothetical protein n=1 Tax=Brunnivagina elsteri TaxID=1247191 RepID=UPI001FE8DE43|nr:hypothetical protein [Calothrix elsteri]
MGLPNNAVKEHLNALFGEIRANQVREKLQNLKPEERELTIVEAICEALKEMGGKYVFCIAMRTTRTYFRVFQVKKCPIVMLNGAKRNEASLSIT